MEFSFVGVLLGIGLSVAAWFILTAFTTFSEGMIMALSIVVGLIVGFGITLSVNGLYNSTIHVVTAILVIAFGFVSAFYYKQPERDS